MTYGPGAGDTGSPKPPPARVGLLVGLVAVLLMICGGIAFTGYRFVGTDSGDRSAANGPNWDPPVRTPDPGLPTPARSEPAVPSTPGAPGSPSAPATLAPEPFGTSYPAVWPDGLRAMVLGVQLVDLPADAGDYPPGLYIGVVIRLEIDNDTPAALTITQAEVQLYYYGVQAAPFVDPAGHDTTISGTIRRGGRLVGAAAFAVPRTLMSNLEFELTPRPGDAPARFVGSAG